MESGEQVASEAEIFSKSLALFNLNGLVILEGILLWWKRIRQVIISLAVSEIIQHPTFVPVASLLVSSRSFMAEILSWW